MNTEQIKENKLGLPVLYFYLGVGLCVGVGGTVICIIFCGPQFL